MTEQQPTLFSDDHEDELTEAEAKRMMAAIKAAAEPEASIARAAEGNESWVSTLVGIIQNYEPGFRFTTDRLWWEVDTLPAPRDPRAMGAVLRKAQGLGLIENTDERHISTRPQNHKRPITIWRRT